MDVPSFNYGVRYATTEQISPSPRCTIKSTQKNGVIWKNLVRWVQDEHGGSIHPALCLEGGDDDEVPRADRNGTVVARPRGVMATRAISKGEWLIRLPSTAVVSGASIVLRDELSSVQASSWLKCVAAFYQVSQSSEDWHPYLVSLPALEEYETLFQWSDDQVKRYLAGTTIGTMVEDDRNQGLMMKRYQLAVRPFLRKLGLVPLPAKPPTQHKFDGVTDDDTCIEDTVTKQEFDTFLQACMCISTRGFHLTALEDRADDTGAALTSDTDEKGPFLLPIIDLLNHNPANKCTTLHKDEITGMFCMKAERDIAAGEELFHSYGDNLSAAQLLHTFGFAPPQSHSITGLRSLTPVILNKRKHLLAACENVKRSSIPTEIRDWMTTRALINDYGEVWDVASVPNRPLNDADAPDDWLISTDNLTTGILTDELITFVVIQFLPQEASDEIIDEESRILAWLDRSILEDVYLRKLLGHALLDAIDRKKMEYTPLEVLKGQDVTCSGPLERDKTLLKELLLIPSPNLSEWRAIYGLRVRIEELSSLEELAKEVTALFECLQLSTLLDVVRPSPKKCKVE